MDGGGASFLSGGDFLLGGTLGQLDVTTLASDAFELRSGYWPGTEPGECEESSDPLGDLNSDGLVNGPDLGILLGQWGAPGTPCSADLTATAWSAALT